MYEKKKSRNINKTDLITSKASNAANKLATTAHNLRIFLTRTRRRISCCRGRSSSGFSFGALRRRRRLGVLVFPFEWLVLCRGSVIDQTPSLEKIEDPTNGPHVAHKSLSSVREGYFSRRGLLTLMFSELLDDGVSVVHVNLRVLGRRTRIEEFWEETNLAFVNVVP